MKLKGNFIEFYNTLFKTVPETRAPTENISLFRN